MERETGTDLAAKRPPDLAIGAFYRVSMGLMALVLRLFARWEVRGIQHIPRHGGVLVVANHLHNADPPLLAASLRGRRLVFMAKAELFEKRPASLAIKLFGAFPVRRFEADLRALRTAGELLKSGEAVTLLPEGHRNRTGITLQQPFPGAALIALRAGVPIVPVGIVGTEQIRGLGVLLKHPRITVTVGKPFVLPAAARINSAAVRAASDEIMRHIAAVLPPEYRGAWGEE